MRVPRWVFWCSGIASAGGASVILKDYLGGPAFDTPVELKGKVAVVTGANTGIGFQVALGLAGRGAKVYLACRERESCETAREDIALLTRNRSVYCRYCDLASQESIRRFAKRIQKDEEKLDILVNNAGIMWTPYSVTTDGIEMQLGVNHMGHFLLTNLLIDKLKNGAPSRIVNVASAAHFSGKINVQDLNGSENYNKGDAYNQSKLANVLFTRELAKRLEGTGVSVNAVHPGVVNTSILRHSNFFLRSLKFITTPFVWPFIKSPKQGAQNVLYVALEPSLQNVSGKYFDLRDMKEPSPDAQNDSLALWLWLVSEKWTKLGDAQKEVLGHSSVTNTNSTPLPNISSGSNSNVMKGVEEAGKSAVANTNTA